MNSVLQNLINIDFLTRYLLDGKNYLSIISSPNNLELTKKYFEVLFNTCLEDKDQTYYEPFNFKEIIIKKNSLFDGVQGNNSKDLINFLLEEMHTELKSLENKDNNNTNSFVPIQKDMNNQILTLNNFKKLMRETNSSIISKLFFILIENLNNCQGCHLISYNYEVNFVIEFTLENVYNFCCKNNFQIINTQTNKIIIPLIQCFNNYYQSSLFTGVNQIYCNKCQKENNATYVNSFYSFPPILIIILKRGNGKIFNYEVDYPLDLNLSNYCKNYEGNTRYKLKGVITHLESNGIKGHFIAYCRHRITNEWYCYNDVSVSKLEDQINGFKNGTPYILFYEGIDNNNNFIFSENYYMINMNFVQNGNINLMNNQYNNIINQNMDNINFINNNLNINKNTNNFY